MWQQVEYHPMLWERSSVEREVRGRLVLQPRGSDGTDGG